MTDLKSMAIVPMHEWKVPLKYRAVLLFLSGPLGLGGVADTMVWGGYLRSGGNKNLQAHTYLSYVGIQRGALLCYQIIILSSPLPLPLPLLATHHHHNHGHSLAS